MGNLSHLSDNKITWNDENSGGLSISKVKKCEKKRIFTWVKNRNIYSFRCYSKVLWCMHIFQWFFCLYNIKISWNWVFKLPPVIIFRTIELFCGISRKRKIWFIYITWHVKNFILTESNDLTYGMKLTIIFLRSL